jgi:hypothetical protein
MRVRKLVTGSLMAAALAVPVLTGTAAHAQASNFLVEGPFSTLAACQHRADWWNNIDGRDHYCVHQTSGGYTPGWYVWVWS